VVERILAPNGAEGSAVALAESFSELQTQDTNIARQIWASVPETQHTGTNPKSRTSRFAQQFHEEQQPFSRRYVQNFANASRIPSDTPTYRYYPSTR
jgi:hypothetical protein